MGRKLARDGRRLRGPIISKHLLIRRESSGTHAANRPASDQTARRILRIDSTDSTMRLHSASPTSTASR